MIRLVGTPSVRKLIAGRRAGVLAALLGLTACTDAATPANPAPPGAPPPPSTGPETPAPPPQPDAGAPIAPTPNEGPDAGQMDPDAAPPPVEPPGPDPGPHPLGEGLSDPLPPCLRNIEVSNTGAFEDAITSAMPGDCLVLSDGSYTFPTITKNGTAEAPIVIRAANRLQATVTNEFDVTESSYIVIEGLTLTGGGVNYSDSSYSRLTRCRVQPSSDRSGSMWVHVRATSHHVRIDHNDMGPKTAQGNMIQLSGPTGGQVVQYIWIDHNHFHDVRYGGGNGWETIRAGYSHLAPTMGFHVIEHNLFVAATGDPETISIKSSDAIVRHNTFREVNGQITLRHGNRTHVYGNFLLDSGGGGTGIRIYGADHKIYDNYLDGSGDILLGAGSADGTEERGTAHYRVYRAEVVHNTIIGSGVSLGGGRQPVDCIIANNLTQGGNIGGGGENTQVMGNITDGAGMAQVEGFWRLVSGSPAIDAAMGAFDYVTHDADGQPRMGTLDVGADELSPEAVLYGPLTEADVGPDAP